MQTILQNLLRLFLAIVFGDLLISHNSWHRNLTACYCLFGCIQLWSGRQSGCFRSLGILVKSIVRTYKIFTINKSSRRAKDDSVWIIPRLVRNTSKCKTHLYTKSKAFIIFTWKIYYSHLQLNGYKAKKKKKRMANTKVYKGLQNLACWQYTSSKIFASEVMGWEICLMATLIPLSANGSHQEATCTFRDWTSVALDALPTPVWEPLRAGDLYKPKVSYIFGFLYCTFITVPARATSGETCTFPRSLVVSMSSWQNFYYLSDQQVSSLACNHCCQSPIKWEKFPLLIHKEIPPNSNVLLKLFVYSDITAFLKVYCTLGFTKTYFL